MKFTNMFIDQVHSDEDFYEALKLVHTVSKGNIYIIGGYVYRNIISGLDGETKKECDIDFIVGDIRPDYATLENWDESTNSFNNPRFVNESVSVDIVPINTIDSIKRRGVNRNISNYLTGTPLNVQSIAFDVQKHEVIGEVGLRSIEGRLVKKNCRSQLEHYAKMKNISPNDYIQNKADSLGFRAELLNRV